MKPFTVVFIGRPNVGKSSLFNALLGFRRSIVYNEPGTTLDQVTETVDFGKGPLRLLDCQGVFAEGDKHVLDALLAKADAVLFVVDSSVGLTPFDRWIAKCLQVEKKHVLLCANKTEGSRSEWEFSELGFAEMIAVSAAHRTNIAALKEWCAKQQGTPIAEEVVLRKITLALVGRPNTGKSTLMNRLCREMVSRVSSQPLTTRDPVSYEIDVRGTSVRLFDTAGMRRPRSTKGPIEEFSIHAATRTIRQADVIFLLIASHEPISDQDMRLLSLLQREGKPAAVLFNFWDRMNAESRKEFRDNMDLRPFLRDFETLSISASTGWNTSKLLPLAVSLAKRAAQRVQTSTLNRIVERIVNKNPPPSTGRGNFNILYANQVKVDPPTFVFFMNRRGALPLSYQQYLSNQLRKELRLKSQAIRIHFRGGEDRAR